MNEDENIKKLKKKMKICAILQSKFNCRCSKNEIIPFCGCVEELYGECTYP